TSMIDRMAAIPIAVSAAVEFHVGIEGGCVGGRAAGVVYEIFRQTGSDNAFAATPLPATEAARRLSLRAPCGRDTLFFSLRYLPGVSATLPVSP
ncbi:MAG: hypothetical protein V4729_05935, partial [Pseudomonadota bacterium]